jgi:hypothetical protein
MSGIAHRANGALSAEDVSVDFGATITKVLGFAPKYIRVVSVTDKVIHEWFEGMDVGDYIEEVAAGDKTLETDDLLAVTADGFVITVAANPTMTDNDLTVWEAFG